MKTPKGMSEEDVLQVIDRVIDRFYKKFIFSYHEASDVRQEARILALEGLEKYNGLYPLEHFLSVHIRNRLCNFKRKNYVRIDKPCFNCPFNAYVNGECTKYNDINECEPFSKWNVKNEAKRNIISPIGLSYTVDDNEQNLHYESDPVDSMSNKEMMAFIDENISVENRSIWLKLRGGIKISKIDQEKVKSELKTMLEENNFYVPKNR